MGPLTFRPVNIQHSLARVVGLTWAFLDAEGSVGVFGPGVVLQLEGDGVVDERLRTLGHTGPAVIEVGAGLQREKLF